MAVETDQLRKYLTQEMEPDYLEFPRTLERFRKRLIHLAQPPSHAIISAEGGILYLRIYFDKNQTYAFGVWSKSQEVIENSANLLKSIYPETAIYTQEA